MLTVNQEKYVNARLRGLSQRKAYREAYPRSVGWTDNAVDVSASKLEKVDKVSLRLEQGKAKAARKALKSKEEYLSDLNTLWNCGKNEAIRKEQSGKFSGYVVDSMVKLSGVLLPEAERAEQYEEGAFIADYAMRIAPAFFNPHRMIAQRSVSDIWLGGGRGSAKSSFASIEVIKYIEENPNEHAAVLMKYKNALRDGAYAQIVWAINDLGLAEEYDMPDSTLRIRKKSTGQLILFRGCDKAEKNKGWKVPFGKIGIVWYEETDLFSGMTEIRKVNQTVSRGSGGKTIRLYTFNPPRSNRSWINVHIQSELDSDARYFESNYKDVPIEWLGEQFVNDAEHLRDVDLQSYLHEYMGEPVGNGTEVFDRVEFRTITDEEIERFDNFKAGQDFGWYPDPWAWTLSHWQQSGRTLYTFAEGGGNKLHPAQQAERILEGLGRFKLNALTVWSDDADPEAISSQRDGGVNARPAGKGGKRDASYRFLQSCKWVIDPQRCPNLAREVRAMQYEINRDGEVLNCIPDGNDHWVDATRYALMRNVKHARDAYRGDE